MVVLSGACLGDTGIGSVADCGGPDAATFPPGAEAAGLVQRTGAGDANERNLGGSQAAEAFLVLLRTISRSQPQRRSTSEAFPETGGMGWESKPDQATRPESVGEHNGRPTLHRNVNADGDPLIRALIEHEIARMLVEMGVRAERLSPNVRLLQDLRIEGQDAADFFEAVVARFGTDLTSLHKDWIAYFGPEGLSITAGAAVAMGSAVAVAAASLAGLPVTLCAVSAAMGGTAAWLVGKRTSTGQLRPICLSEVADAIERGCWDGRARTGHRRGEE